MSRYFVQDDYCGISAFVNRPDTQSARNASMLAVGVLVPLDHGRLGRSWRHAEDLKELARYGIKERARAWLTGQGNKLRILLIPGR